MDSKDLQLYHEESRKYLIDLNKGISDLTKLIQKQIDNYEPPKEDVKVTGSVEVNTQKEVEITNLEELLVSIKQLGDILSGVIVENAIEIPESVRILNPDDMKVDSMKVSNLSDIKKYFDILANAIKNNKPIVKVEKQEVTFPISPRDAIPVRLSNGEKFYEAVMQAISGGGETDPLVGYQPSDIDDSGSTKYYGFVKANGYWYIMRQSSTGSYRYIRGAPSDENGGGLYSDAWTNRANLTYNYFYEVF